MIALTQAILPQFRERRSGVIVNITSSVPFGPLSLLSVYTASKAAVNAFTDSVALELEPFGICVRVVLPGRTPGTSFADNARVRMTAGFPKPMSKPSSTCLRAGNRIPGRSRRRTTLQRRSGWP